MPRKRSLCSASVFASLKLKCGGCLEHPPRFSHDTTAKQPFSLGPRRTIMLRRKPMRRLGFVLRNLLWPAFLTAALTMSASFALGQQSTEDISVDAHAVGKPFPPFWEEMFGSGSANLAMRDNYRKDLRLVK